MLLCVPLFGIDRDLRINQLYHTSWTHKDGVPTEIQALAQTTDGFLWIGSGSGLYRFDGLKFELYQPSQGQFPKVIVTRLLATPDGGLWIGYAYGTTSFLKDGKIINYDTEVASAAGDMARDEDGTVWRAAGPKGLSRFVDSHWETVGATWNFSGSALGLRIDRGGTLWVDTGHGILNLPKGARKFQPLADLTAAHFPFAESDSGTIWSAEWTGRLDNPRVVALGPGPIRRKFDVGGRLEPMIFDKQGSLWMGTIGKGIVRIQDPERSVAKHEELITDTFRRQDGLSSDYVLRLLEDREGDIWAVTNGGLDRFRQTPLITVKLPSDSYGFSLSARGQGDIDVGSWTGEHNFVEIRKGTAILQKDPPLSVDCAYQDSEGITWLGTEFGIVRFLGHRIERIDSPDPRRVAGQNAFSVTKDGAGRLVALFNGEGLNRLDKGRWTNLATLGLPAHNGLIVAADSAGRIWEGFTNNRIGRVEGDAVTVFTDKDGVTVGDVTKIGMRNGSVWIGGGEGLERFDGHRFVAVAARGGNAFRRITGILAADNGIWFGEPRGILHIPEAECRRVEQDPAYPVQYEVYDNLDGLSGGLQNNSSQPNMIQGTDGRLWFATAQGVVWLDPKRILKQSPPPSVGILSLSANGQTYALPAPADVKLPPRTVNIQFDYTAASLAVPERVRFRYKLEGSDKDWRNAGARREADYTNLGPGTYRFQVMASNGDGAWNQAGAAAGFVIQPAFFQTYWFYALCVCAAGGVLRVFYLFRLRQIAAAMNARFDERLAERTRVAREFHDTLLQTIQGSKLVADDALRHDGDPIRTRGALERLSLWLGQAIQDGRAALSSLRDSTMEGNDLAEAFKRAGEECTFHRSIQFEVSVEGSGVEMHPIVRDEVYRIGYESIQNACAHSEGTRVTVELSYLGDLVLRVSDDGHGIEEQVAAKGKSGHFGLVGMYERAARVRGKLTISSSPGAGTKVELVVPGEIVFQSPNRRRPGLRERIRRFF
jgi:signal transduction histidine kinase/ligand-binding sensor domain-containing protein